MKKILSILVLAIVAVQFAFAGDVITKDNVSIYNRLLLNIL